VCLMQKDFSGPLFVLMSRVGREGGSVGENQNFAVSLRAWSSGEASMYLGNDALLSSSTHSENFCPGVEDITHV